MPKINLINPKWYRFWLRAPFQLESFLKAGRRMCRMRADLRERVASK